jgi:hypothetical protein
LILAADFVSHDDSATTAVQRAAPPSPPIWEMFREQEQLLAELVGEKPAANRPKSVPSRPQSFYRYEFLNA